MGFVHLALQPSDVLVIELVVKCGCVKRSYVGFYRVSQATVVICAGSMVVCFHYILAALIAALTQCFSALGHDPKVGCHNIVIFRIGHNPIIKH